MEENKNLTKQETELGGEQPKEQEAHTATAEENETGATKAEMGSLVGKFKNVEDLALAYKNLQAEFTRKSQKLSQTLKELESKSNTADAPTFTKENWQEEVENFLTKNPTAKKYATEITEAILNDTFLHTSKNSLELAYKKVLAGKYKEPEALVADEDFVNNYILNNPKISERVVTNYLNSLQQKKAVPLISSHTGSSFSITPKTKPKSLSEAKELAKAYFKI